jgi:hypothetical protein
MYELVPLTEIKETLVSCYTYTCKQHADDDGILKIREVDDEGNEIIAFVIRLPLAPNFSGGTRTF